MVDRLLTFEIFESQLGRTELYFSTFRKIEIHYIYSIYIYGILKINRFPKAENFAVNQQIILVLHYKNCINSKRWSNDTATQF